MNPRRISALEVGVWDATEQGEAVKGSRLLSMSCFLDLELYFLGPTNLKR